MRRVSVWKWVCGEARVCGRVCGRFLTPSLFSTPPPLTAKGALGPLVRSLALAWAPAGIRANLVLPGPADTPFTRTVLSSKARVAATVAALPAFRLGAASDFIAPILFFASDGAAFCTGASLVVDGGGTARGMAPA